MEALLFAPAAVAIALTPGPNNFCGLNNGIRAGVAAALIATVGRVAAFAIFLTVSAVGLGAMLLASEAAFTAADSPAGPAPTMATSQKISLSPSSASGRSRPATWATSRSGCSVRSTRRLSPSSRA